VFAREVTPGLTSLVKKLEAAANAHADQKLRAVVVILSDDDKTEAQLKKLAEKEHLKRVVLAVDNPQGPDRYEIAKDADVTAVLYVKKKVKKNFAFEKGKLTEAEAEAVTAATKDILPAKSGDK